jgi:hypothetical protein
MVTATQEFDDLYIGLVSTETAPLFDGVEDLVCDVARQKQVTLSVVNVSMVPQC